MPELKPCPFCGGEAERKKYNGKLVRISCSACGMQTPIQQEDVKRIWNTRQPQGINWQPIGELPNRKIDILLTRNDYEKPRFDTHSLSLLDGEINYLSQNYTHFAKLTPPEVEL